MQASFQQTALFNEVQQEYATEVKSIFENKCRDCHSDRGKLPFYHFVPGVGQQIDEDVRQGRKAWDFSCDFPFLAGGTFSPLETRNLLQGVRRAIVGNTMPPTKYILLHPTTRLSSTDKKSMLDWIRKSEEVLGIPSTCGEKDSACQVKALFERECSGCHDGGQAQGGLGKITKLANLVGTVVIPKDAKGSRLFQKIDQGKMPLSRDQRGVKLPKPDRDLVRRWIDTGAVAEDSPTKPEILRDAEVHQAILQDLKSVSEYERRFKRYLTLTHFRNSGTTVPEIAVFRQALAKLLNSLSYSRTIVLPEQVKGTDDTVFRFDIEQLGWDESKWRQLQKFYPYALLTERTKEISQLTGLGQDETAVVRGDWFTFAVSRHPLYDLLLGLPGVEEAKTDSPTAEQQLEQTLDVSVQTNIENGHALRAGFLRSGVSDFNRVIERHPSKYKYYWKSYDFQSSGGRQDIRSNPLGPRGPHARAHVFERAGGELIFSLPNGLQAYMLTNSKGDSINNQVAPGNIVRDPAFLGFVVNGISCMRCHVQGIIPKQDEVAQHVSNQADGRFSTAERALISQLYGRTADLKQRIEDDRLSFMLTLAKTGVLPVEEADEQVAKLDRRFRQALTIHDAAAEFGVTVEELRQGCATAAISAVCASLSGSGVDRGQFIDTFKKLARSLGQGDLRSFSPLVVPEGSVTVADEDVAELLLLGASYKDRGQYAEAIMKFEAAKVLDPNNQEVLDSLEDARKAWETEKKVLGQ